LLFDNNGITPASNRQPSDPFLVEFAPAYHVS